MNDNFNKALAAMARLAEMNRQDTIIATVAREALSDLQELLDRSLESFPMLRHLRRLLEAEEVQE